MTQILLVTTCLLLATQALAQDICQSESDCNDNGQCVGGNCACSVGWGGETCQHPDCGILDQPMNSVLVEACSVRSFGAMCRLQCETGARQTGGNTTFECGENGQWLGTPIVCVLQNECSQKPCNEEVSMCVELEDGYQCVCNDNLGGLTTDDSGSSCLATEVSSKDATLNLQAAEDVHITLGSRVRTGSPTISLATMVDNQVTMQRLQQVLSSTLTSTTGDLGAASEKIDLLQTSTTEQFSDVQKTTDLLRSDLTNLDNSTATAHQESVDRINYLESLLIELATNHSILQGDHNTLVEDVALDLSRSVTEERERAQGVEQQLTTRLNSVLACNKNGQLYDEDSGSCKQISSGVMSVDVACTSGLEGRLRNLPSNQDRLELCRNNNWVIINAPLGSLSNPARSCTHLLSFAPSTPSGTYFISPTGAQAIELYCDMDRHEGGWTQVYKIADSSNMKNTGAVNVDVLKTDAIANVAVGKLADADLRVLCDDQYFLHQWQSTLNPFFCEIRNMNNFKDGECYNAEKYCSQTYSKSKAGYNTRCGSWSYNFGGWGSAGCVITQLNYGDNRRGSHLVNSGSSVDRGCSGNGGCHTAVFCRTKI